MNTNLRPGRSLFFTTDAWAGLHKVWRTANCPGSQRPRRLPDIDDSTEVGQVHFGVVHIREGNSVISDPAVQPKAFDWQAVFPELASTPEVEPAAKRRKRRKEGKSSSDEAARAADLTYPTQHVILDLELWGAEIDQQAVLNPRGTQVAQDLGHMFVRQGLGCFQLE